jgi:hypothetical protein
MQQTKKKPVTVMVMPASPPVGSRPVSVVPPLPPFPTMARMAGGVLEGVPEGVCDGVDDAEAAVVVEGVGVEEGVGVWDGVDDAEAAEVVEGVGVEEGVGVWDGVDDAEAGTELEGVGEGVVDVVLRAGKRGVGDSG